jgi:ABC-2 type transport system ATP-binding protein
LSLARCLVHNPSVLLLDEPASGLDPAARIALRQLVRSLAAEGRTLLISSHVLAELDEMADRAVYLAAGVTASEERVQRSKSTARAWRIKSSDTNFLKATLTSIGLDETVMDRSELLVPLAGEADAARVLGLLVAGGVPISTFAPAQGELEHTFLELNAGGA